MSADLAGRLREGVEALGLALTDAQLRQLLAYLDLIGKWTRVYNLTAVREPGEMLTHHLLDSLAVIQPLQALTLGRSIELLDVGAGAGLPGVVIAICCPEVQVTCVDTVAKKAAFIQQAAAALQLPNLKGTHSRVEQMSGKYNVITSRAFASLQDFVGLSADVLASDGVWLAMKGKHPAEEIQNLPAGTEVFHVEQLQVPGLEAERCIVWMRQRLASSVE